MGLRSLALLLAALVACKGGPAPPSGFLESPERMATDEELPFDKGWREPGVDWTPYTEIMVAPVNTNYLMEMSWWGGLSFAGDRRKDARELGLYLQSRMFDAFESDPRQRYKPLAFAEEEPGPETLLLELALVEIVPPKMVLKLLGGPTGLGTGTVAIEARIRDATSQKVLAMFADRRTTKRGVLNLPRTSWTSHAEEIIDDWSVELVEIANRRPGERVEGASPFKLRPW